MKKILFVIICMMLVGCISIHKKISYTFNVEDQERINITYTLDNDEFKVIEDYFIISNQQYEVYGYFINKHHSDFHKSNNQKYNYKIIDVENSSYQVLLTSNIDNDQLINIAKQLVVKKD